MQKVMDLRLWKTLTIAFMIVAIVTIAHFGWELRQPIIEKVTGPKLRVDGERVPNPSEKSKKEWNAFSQKYDWIEGINIIRVDFKRNTRGTTHRDYKDAGLEEAWIQWIRDNGETAPLFSLNESTNQRLVNLINGQFSCSPVLETSAGQLIPEVRNYVVTVCSAPIPPGYGDFIGFVNIFLRRQPTLDEIEMLKNKAERLSLEMYERDVVKSQRSFSELGTSNQPIKLN